MDKSKQQFEEFALSPAGGLGAGHLTKDADGDYTNYAAQAYFDFWNGSREALLIELPVKGCPTDEGSEAWHNVRNATIDSCSRAVTAAGLKVRP